MEETTPVINKIPFKVSARTARLIGRENIATSKGAIIELVKNGYDADSKISIVYFDNKYSSLLNEIDENHFQHLLALGIQKTLLLTAYQKGEETYVLNTDLNDDDRVNLRKALAKLSVLYLLDCGEGMTQNVIRDHWMTIGTDNKATNVFTSSGRVKAGAKGIGRFALDKLGGKCEMTTVFNPADRSPDTDSEGIRTTFSGYKWIVDWEDFEGDFKTIDSVDAQLIGLNSNSFEEELRNIIPELSLPTIKDDQGYKFGTILKITDLRDNWDDYFVDQVYSDLEVLVPPKETGGFEIYVFSSLTPNKYGEVFGSICDDFDYKLHAVADDKQNVTITIYRNEYDVELIDQEFFNREEMQNYPFKKDDFLKGKWKKETTFSKLIPGFAASDEDNVFMDIGVFDFTFYFLKRSFSTPDANRFFYRKFQSNLRKDWLEKFGGIKLFRDNFRVRPYGETKDAAFDWLGLGNRKSSSPAGVAKEEGGYRVEPENVAGAVKISRLTNVNFEDKSSREGLQENKTFQIFKTLLAAIIRVFEDDRAFIAKEMSIYDNVKFGDARNKKAAQELTQRILAQRRAKKAQQQSNGESLNSSSGTNENQEGSNEDEEKEILADEIERKDEEIEKLKEEQIILRGLASSGIVLASFSHDLSKLNDVLSSRMEKLRNILLEKLTEQEYVGVAERKNPFFQIEKLKKQDSKMQNWLNFSLGAARKDKRKRKQLFLKSYFSDLKSDWGTVFENRAIVLDITKIENLDLRVFEIDFDSIFNNLFINSIDAFNLSKHDRSRLINLSTSVSSREIIIDYHDNGPGLSPDIEKPDEIFDAMFTTKRNEHTGEEIGTGLGMWLIKSIVDENDGAVRLLFPVTGFGIRITFPIKYKR
ncbi:Signal transduction histidine kinase [Pedobacter steynii]|uniref:histidine kinase n=1 Tax=Pedobacter steynii TaxID=430522 RepID=A0A1G9UJ76_9SPHI|nr:HAMP domain-containing sensor histidine kinase [Pedobacter steynii]NQX40781.1 HAMP domain-containing histidine kinase [Pedobacter steynii]SDM59854.1 Signal transduction histidine kinase [Pedobacter steynii]